MKEKLIDILECIGIYEVTMNAELIAAHIIANGVTVRAKGRWVVENEASIRCSECCFNRVSIKMPMDYCPICGAHMGW